jgi:DNA-binding beta-propeller fold protein YncE
MVLLALAVVAAGSAHAAGAASASDCTQVATHTYAWHYVRARKTRRVHGHLVVVRRHGHIVYVRVRKRFLTTSTETVCVPAAVIPAPAAVVPVPAAAPTPTGPLPETPTPAPITEAPAPPFGPPLNSSLPAISGLARSGATLTAAGGTWSETPTGYQYQWYLCNAHGESCAPITKATSSEYTIPAEDAGATLRIAVTASNARGRSAPAESAASAPVLPAPGAPVNSTLPTISGAAQTGETLTAGNGTWTESPTGYQYQWYLCNAHGEVCVLIAKATGPEYRIPAEDAGSTVRVDVTASNEYGSSAPAQSAASAPVSAATGPPVNTALPTVSGQARTGDTLTAGTGAWTESPSGYKYQWYLCNAHGEACASIAKATSAQYRIPAEDAGSTIRVDVTASNAHGSSAPARSGASAPVVPVQHLEYVVQIGHVYVYDMEDPSAPVLVKTITVPTETGVRGVMVAPSSHLMFITYGGDSDTYHGSVLAYNLVTEKVAWNVHLGTGIDSGSVSPDGKRLYVPTGELSEGHVWNVLSTANGEVLETIEGGKSPHNTVISPDGRYLYMGGRNEDYLWVENTETKAESKIGPLAGGVRPFTVNGSNTLAFTTATGLDGFQVSSISTGKVLFTVSFGPVPEKFPFSAPSHGIALSPDEHTAYVIDSVHREVRVYNVAGAGSGTAPTEIAAVPVAGLEGEEQGCQYDCTRGGWLQASVGGGLLYVGDSGDVIDTTTDKVVSQLTPLLDTKQSIEVEWEGGVPVATSTRTAVGQVP